MTPKAQTPVHVQQDKSGLIMQVSVTVADQMLLATIQLRNDSNADIYVLNHLWHNVNGQPSPDPENVYRFLHGNTLRMLYGPAPLPRLKTVTYRNVPFVSLLKPRAVAEWKSALPVPVKEYSAYDIADNNTIYQPASADNVEVIVEFIRARPEITVAAAPFEENVLRITSQGAWTFAEILRSGAKTVRLPVQRRTDDFSRLTLPGEQPEPLNLPMK